MKSIDLALTYDDVLLLPKHGAEFFPSGCDTKTKITRKITLDKPIISSGMPTVTEKSMAIEMAKFGGVGIIHPYLETTEYIKQINAVKKMNLIVGAAVGDQDWDKVKGAVLVNADFIAIDAAHGDTLKSLDFIKKIKNKYPNIEIMAGCFATPEGVFRAIKSGADSIRVGIGPGSHCTTRIVSGVGYPQLTAIQKCSIITKKYKIPLIAEGGIRNSGDIVKAIAAGAQAVMIGGLLIGTDQSPGKLYTKNGKQYKKSWGYCSTNAQDLDSNSGDKLSITKFLKKNLQKHLKRDNHISEGVENVILPYKGDVRIILQQLSDGIKTGLAYTGNKNLISLQKTKEFVRITNAGLTESYPHDVIFE
jgi:IMP dehydrogenase